MQDPSDSSVVGGTEMVRAFGALQSLLLAMPNVATFLDELSRLAAEVLDPPASCGITTRRGSRPLTVASSDARANALDETQYDIGDGPCLQTMRTGDAVEVPDMTTDARWPLYAELAERHGLRCSLSLPLMVDGHPAGAMNLYNFTRVNGFDGDQRRHAEVFAAQASAAITLTFRQAQQAEVAEQLEAALGSRSVIDQAIGILMAQQHCNADAAFDLLRRHSQNNNIPIRDLAAQLLTRTTGEPPREGKFRRSDDRR